jgi:hypothetical protein
MRPSSTLSREEAQQKLSAFIQELDNGWKRDGLEWGPELLALLREFDQAARRQETDGDELARCRERVVGFVGGRKPLKGGLGFLIKYVDAICEKSE